jgi:tryptophan synthase alpha chain
VLSLANVFRQAQQAGRIALIGYLPAGYPDRKTFLQIAQSGFAAGLDILEIGLSTPKAVLDGEVIQTALQVVNRQEITVEEALALGAQALAHSSKAGLVMVYASMLAKFGQEAMLSHCARLGIAGILPVGMPEADWQAFATAACRHGVAPIGIISPDMDEAGVRTIVQHAGGFLYLQSYSGPTGQPAQLDQAVRERIELARSCMGAYRLPIAVGFGIKKGEDIARVRALGADGVIVGTAFVEAATQGSQATHRLVTELSQATVFQEV